MKRSLKPLVIMGPTCSGKTKLISHLKNEKPGVFEHVLNYTTRKLKGHLATPGFDYHKPPGGDDFFEQENDKSKTSKPMWLYKFRSDQVFSRALSGPGGIMYKDPNPPYWNGILY